MVKRTMNEKDVDSIWFLKWVDPVMEPIKYSIFKSRNPLKIRIFSITDT